MFDKLTTSRPFFLIVLIASLAMTGKLTAQTSIGNASYGERAAEEISEVEHAESCIVRKMRRRARPIVAHIPCLRVRQGTRRVNAGLVRAVLHVPAERSGMNGNGGPLLI